MNKKILLVFSFLVLMIFPYNNVYADTNFEIVGLTTQTGTPTPTDPINIVGRTGEIQETIDNQEYTFNLGNIILDSIGSYTDKIYKDSDKWYLQKNTKRIILNGTESWNYLSTRKLFYIVLSDIPQANIQTNNFELSNRFENKGVNIWNDYSIQYGFLINNENLLFRNLDYTTTSNFQTWLSNNNVEVIYPLSTSITTEITDETLLNQLNSVGQEVVPTPTPQENNYAIYLPNYNGSNCVEIIDKDTIRVFENQESLSYTDYYINSHYISKNGLVDNSYQKSCSNLNFTTDYKYRNDFPYICFITLCLIGFTILPCYMLWKVFYKRGR